jgi:hypothetical protein
MLHLDSLVVARGAYVTAPLHVANDGPALDDVQVEVQFSGAAGARGIEDLLAVDGSTLDLEAVLARFPEASWAIRISRLPAYRTTRAGTAVVAAPSVPGSHDLVLTLRSDGEIVGENRYPIHVVQVAPEPVGVRLLGEEGETLQALEAVGSRRDDQAAVAVVAEAGLDAAAGREARAVLSSGGSVLVLAQPPEVAEHYPTAVSLTAVETKWGSSVFHFTTDHGGLPSLPRRAVLVAEDSTVQARSAVTAVEGRAFPDTPVVVAYKPVPSALTGTVVGVHRVGRGRLVLCQYRLAARAAGGDAAACALLADLLRLTRLGQPELVEQHLVTPDGRAVTAYTGPSETAA